MSGGSKPSSDKKSSVFHDVLTGFEDSPGLLFGAYPGYFPVLKQPGREADQSALSRANVKNEWS